MSAEALARVLADYRRTITDTDQVKAMDLHQAQQMLRDPAPLLAALPDSAIEAEALRRFYPARHLTGMSDR